jgi:SAM-dependent methyltransferase
LFFIWKCISEKFGKKELLAAKTLSIKEIIPVEYILIRHKQAMVSVMSFLNKRIVPPWIPASLKAIMLALSLADVNEDDRLVDVGCGDGRVCIVASKYLKAHCTCVEIDEELCALAEANAMHNHVRERVNIVCGDAFQQDFREFSVVYMYMYRSFNDAISKKLDKELLKGSRVVTVDFPISEWIPITLRRTVDEKGVNRTVFLYVIGISNPSSWRPRLYEGYPVWTERTV